MKSIACESIVDILETVYKELEIPVDGLLVKVAKPRLAGAATLNVPTEQTELMWAWG
jgi:hypothetical protein